MAIAQVIFKGEFSKVDKVHKVAYGWAYVTESDATTVVDHSGDTWDIAQVEKTAHQFVCDCRVGGESHVFKGGAELVESLVFSKAVQEALGIDLKKQGWFVGFKITDETLLEKIEKGELSMFSIGGNGNREAI